MAEHANYVSEGTGSRRPYTSLRFYVLVFLCHKPRCVLGIASQAIGLFGKAQKLSKACLAACMFL